MADEFLRSLERDLQALSNAMEGTGVFIGLRPASGGARGEPPAVGEWWAESSGASCDIFVQASVQPRLRFRIAGAAVEDQ